MLLTAVFLFGGADPVDEQTKANLPPALKKYLAASALVKVALAPNALVAVPGSVPFVVVIVQLVVSELPVTAVPAREVVI